MGYRPDEQALDAPIIKILEGLDDPEADPWPTGKASNEVEADPNAKPHTWKYEKDYSNSTHKWKCERCGSITWTGVMNDKPPGPGDLNNSLTYEDCDEALARNIMDETVFKVEAR